MTARFTDQILQLEEMSFNGILSLVASLIPENLISTAKARVSGGIRLLKTELELNDYLVAFGEIHRAKLMEFLPHLPWAKLAETGVAVIDWGCGQGLATAVLMDYLRANHLGVGVKRIGLIEIVPAALRRADAIARRYVGNGDAPIEVRPWNVENLASIFEGLPKGTPVLHLFSNILDVRTLDIESVHTAVERLRKDRMSYIVSCGPDMETKHSRPEQLLEFLQMFKSPTLLHVFPNGNSGRLYGNWKYWPYRYCKCYGFAYALSPIIEKASSSDSVPIAPEVSLPKPKSDPEDLVMYASEGMPEEVEGALSGGCPVDHATEKGATALYFAAKHGHVTCVRLLLAARADTERRVHSTGMTPYLIAVKYEHTEIMQLLAGAGCDVLARDVRGRSASEIVRAYGLDVETADVVARISKEVNDGR